MLLLLVIVGMMLGAYLLRRTPRLEGSNTGEVQAYVAGKAVKSYIADDSKRGEA